MKASHILMALCCLGIFYVAKKLILMDIEALFDKKQREANVIGNIIDIGPLDSDRIVS